MDPIKRIAYTLRIDLADSRPPIWRRIGVDGEITLGMLHHVNQAAFGWTDSHLHDFEIHGDCYGNPEQDSSGDLDFIDEHKVKLKSVAGAGDTFVYRYDFGDDWEHRIKIEAAEPLTSTPLSSAWLLTGRRACPPEDVGGIWAYGEFLEDIAIRGSEAARDRLEWLGCDAFGPAHFAVEAAKTAVASVSRRRVARHTVC